MFLGYASRIGKSLRMFDEGRRRKARGQDVVVAAIQGEISAEVREILSKLPVIPQIDGRVIDLSTLFQRHPEVCLIDGLAYDNPPGSRNRERWQDVRELLDHGISVVTAVNVQHIRERQDEVARITGKRAAHSIPQEFLREADEIEVVDAPPEALLGRTGDGDLPDSRQLSELRELALLLAADVVDRQLQEYLECHGVVARWGAQERILVCLTPRSSAEEMLRSGHRNAVRFHGALLVAYVDQPGISEEDRRTPESHLEVARECRAEVHCLPAGDFVETILEFAREQRITQLFLGHTAAAAEAAFHATRSTG